MATFEGEVTQAGWRCKVSAGEDSAETRGTIERLADTFIARQTYLQAEGQRFVRETLRAESFGLQTPEEANGQAHTEEAETLTDSKVPDPSP